MPTFLRLVTGNIILCSLKATQLSLLCTTLEIPLSLLFAQQHQQLGPPPLFSNQPSQLPSKPCTLLLSETESTVLCQAEIT